MRAGGDRASMPLLARRGDGSFLGRSAAIWRVELAVRRLSNEISRPFAALPTPPATSLVSAGLERPEREVKIMNRHVKLLSGILAAGLTLMLAPGAAADPPSWAGVWRHNKHVNGAGDFAAGEYRYDRCGSVLERIDHDRDLIAQWQHTGRHQKVVQWAHEDIAKARQDLYACRSETRPGYGYDPYVYPARGYDDGYDPYYESDRGFDWNRDWPWLVGSMITGQLGR
jgi:hypothetical protein